MMEIRGGGNIASIGKGTFSGCTSLESLTIPEGVPEIGKDTLAARPFPARRRSQ